MKIVVILSVAQLVTTFILFSAWQIKSDWQCSTHQKGLGKAMRLHCRTFHHTVDHLVKKILDITLLVTT